MEVRLPASARALLAVTGGQAIPTGFAGMMAGLLGGLDVYDIKTSTSLFPGGLSSARSAVAILRSRRCLPKCVVALTGIQAGACILLDCSPAGSFRPRGALYALTRATDIALPASHGASFIPHASRNSFEEGPLEDALLSWLEARADLVEIRARSRLETEVAVDRQFGDRGTYLPAWPLMPTIQPVNSCLGSAGESNNFFVSSKITGGIRIHAGAALITMVGGAPDEYAVPLCDRGPMLHAEAEFDWTRAFPALSPSPPSASSAAKASGSLGSLGGSGDGEFSKKLLFSYRLRIQREREEEEVGHVQSSPPHPSHDITQDYARNRAVTLTTREWRFGDSTQNTPTQTGGPGVVGLFPTLDFPWEHMPPPAPFQYSSCTELENPPGWMEGALNFRVEGETKESTQEFVRAEVGRFYLGLPPFIFT